MKFIVENQRSSFDENHGINYYHYDKSDWVYMMPILRNQDYTTHNYYIQILEVQRVVKLFYNPQI